MYFYQFVLLQGVWILSIEQKQHGLSSKNDANYSNDGVKNDILLPRKEAISFLKREKRWFNMKRYEYECVEELCWKEELIEMGHTFGKYTFNRLRNSAKYFYCSNHDMYKDIKKRYPTSYLCDGDNDCGNSYDEKYCRFDTKYRSRTYSNYELRRGTSLRGGKSKYEGNVYLFGRPVCDDDWDVNDAKVVCRSLGFPPSNVFSIPTDGNHFSYTSSDDFILDNVNCQGDEDNLGVCYDYLTHHNCKSKEAAGVKCIDPNAVELKGGESRHEGNVYLSDRPVCDDGWDKNNAKVVCRQLGYSSDVLSIPTTGNHFSYYGSQSSDFVLDDVNCMGNENNLGACYDYLTRHNCQSSEAAGVKCIDPNAVELKGGKSRYEGNVYLSGKPVCENDWDKNDAQVVCRQIGCSSDVLSIPTTGNYFSYYGSQSSDFVLDDVNCMGNENNIGACYNYRTDHNCQSNQAAGVKCIDPNAVELKGGSSSVYGNVFISGKPVCDDYWDDRHAKVICNTLGYSSETIGIAKKYNHWTAGNGGEFVLDDIKCNGYERHILQCTYSTTEDCSTGEEAGIVCFDPKSIKIRKDGFIQALDGVKVIGMLGKHESQVACNQQYGKNFESGFVPVYQTLHESDFLLSWWARLFRSRVTVISNLKCNGNEIGIHKCKYNLPVVTTKTKYIRSKLYCAKCNQNYLINLLKNLRFDYDLKKQLQYVKESLTTLKRDCHPWKCKRRSKNKYNDYCKVYNVLEDIEALALMLKNHKNIYFLNPKIDYVVRLQHQYMKEKFSHLIKKINDVYSHVTDSQKSLANYYKKLADFENKKLKVYIKMLRNSKAANINNLKNEFGILKAQMKDLGLLASAKNVFDIQALSTDLEVQTTFSFFTALVNIFTSFFTGLSNIFEGLIAIRKKKVAVAKAEVERLRINNILEKLVPKIKAIIRNVRSKLKLNEDKYNVVDKFFERLKSNTFTARDSITFFKKYQTLEPAIDKTQISELDETLSYVTENLCHIIKDTKSLSGTVISKTEASKGLCFNVKVSIRKILGMFEEITDDEDGLKKSFAKLAKAKIRQHEANELFKTSGKTTSTKIDKLILKIKTYIMLQEEKRNFIAESCQYITYLNHGIEKPFCEKLIADPDSHLISKLISYKINADMCDSHVIDHPRVVSIPTYFSKDFNSNDNDSLSSLDGKIDLNGFFKPSSGSHKVKNEIQYQIPNMKWLHDNGWILDPTVQGPIFLKKFELFLPPASTKYKYSVETELIMIKNKLNNVTYMFTDIPHTKCHYDENDHRSNCMVTPYHMGNCVSKVRHLCINTPGDFKGPIYPLATSSWKLIIKSKVPLNEIYPTTNFYLKARVQLCYRRSSSPYRSTGMFNKRKSLFSRPNRSLHCCSKNNQYYDQETLIQRNGINHCKSCPPNSKPRLNGYFCEKCPPGYEHIQDQLYGCEKMK